MKLAIYHRAPTDEQHRAKKYPPVRNGVSLYTKPQGEKRTFIMIKLRRHNMNQVKQIDKTGNKTYLPPGLLRKAARPDNNPHHTQPRGL